MFSLRILASLILVAAGIAVAAWGVPFTISDGISVSVVDQDTLLAAKPNPDEWHRIPISVVNNTGSSVRIVGLNL